MLERPQPPNGKTLALLCLKFVKHRDRAEIRRKFAKSLEKAGKMPPRRGSGAGFRYYRERSPCFYLAFVGVVSGVWVFPD
jgi:hypothetical protein